MMQDLASCPSAFVERKKKILEQLAIPDTEYTDASPKGSVDEGIRDLIDEINQQSGFVTTSSCAGRVSVFLEGRRVAEVEGEDEQIAGVGGKGAGGAWLFVSHDPVPDTGDKNTDWSSMFGLEDSALAQETIGVVKERRLVHFKFEAMVRNRRASSYKTGGNIRIQVQAHAELSRRFFTFLLHLPSMLKYFCDVVYKQASASLVPSTSYPTAKMQLLPWWLYGQWALPLSLLSDNRSTVIANV